jgi:hypothetical protein
MAVEDLRQSPMMSHMLDALDNGEDIGHYGRLAVRRIGAGPEKHRARGIF